MSVSVKEAGIWKEAKDFHVKNGGAWVEVKDAWVKHGGIWKNVFEPSVEITPGAKWSGDHIEFDVDGSYLSDIGTK